LPDTLGTWAEDIDRRATIFADVIPFSKNGIGYPKKH
jgi:hypothetical protein